VTDFYGAAKTDADKERQQGMDAVDAAKQVASADIGLPNTMISTSSWSRSAWAAS
jgi:hypothetical protein